MSAANPSFSHIHYVYRYNRYIVCLLTYFIYINMYACTHAFVLINEYAQNTHMLYEARGNSLSEGQR